MTNLVKLEMRENNYSDLSIDKFDESVTILLKLEKPFSAHSGYVVFSQDSTSQMNRKGLFLFGVYMPTGHYLRKKRVERVVFICQICKSEKSLMPGELRQRTPKFCSKKCEGKSRTIHGDYIQINCGSCQKSFQRRIGLVQDANYCSVKCSGVAKRKPERYAAVSCGICSVKFTKRTDHLLVNNFCSRKCSSISRKVKNPLSKDKQRTRSYMKDYNSRNREKKNLNNRIWNKNNNERRLEIQKRYRQSHKEYLAAAARARRFGLKASTFTQKEWDAMKKFYDYKCLCCDNCEPEIKLEVDHIIAFINGGRHESDNIQPLCRSCNARKSRKTVDFRPNVLT